MMGSIFLCPNCGRQTYSNWCEFCRVEALLCFDRHETLFQDDAHVFVAATGAGPTVISDLWAPPGASKYLIGAVFPYAKEETENFLGFAPERSFCSEQMALHLAAAAFIRARTVAWQYDRTPIVRVFERVENEKKPYHAVGLAITASVASKTLHRGDHRVHVAAITNGISWGKTVILPKNTGDGARIADEETVRRTAHAVLRSALTQTSVNECIPIPNSDIIDSVMGHPFFLADGTRKDADAHDPKTLLPNRFNHESALFFPGAFNPFHDGHKMMAQHCEKRSRRPVIFSIDVDPVHKPALTGVEMLDRVAMFRAQKGITPHILFTRGEALFYDKVTKHPTTDWIVGADTLLRLFHPQWGHELNEMYLTLTKGGKFYVFPCMWDGKLLTVRDVLNTYGLLPRTNGPLPPFVEEMDETTPDVRSSNLRGGTP